MVRGMAPPCPHPGAAGAMAAVISRRGLRRLRTALWTLGDFARCGGRVFRWLRPAGISPRARGGCFARCGGRPGALPPGPLRFFEKNRVKLLTLGFTTRLQTCCKSTGSAPQGGDLPPPYRLLLLTSAGPYPGRDGSSPAGMPAGSQHPHRWSRRRSYR